MAHRRAVALTAAAVLAAEAAGAGWLHWVLGLMADRQKMSLAGLEPRLMAVSTWAGGVLVGACLLLCAALLLRTGLTDRPPARPARALLVAAAVGHGVLGALGVGLVGWAAFAAMMLVLGLLVLTLVAYGPRGRAEEAREPGGPEEPEGPGQAPAGPPGPPLTPTAP
ncbi:hypothetical protein IQ279_15605 [Streptomyces verrucosisporus]|uniref:hypothetical protein n=1 Tax=Streptomyces verrucosisporus TaxID=1695161 RepID=UPI0019D09D36|nr:hypothetical protein [Streptomyces verrucosisporus]MBN3931041.1 hypothetical protein [Streptomyces verrucosisporus]